MHGADNTAASVPSLEFEDALLPARAVLRDHWAPRTLPCGLGSAPQSVLEAP